MVPVCVHTRGRPESAVSSPGGEMERTPGMLLLSRAEIQLFEVLQLDIFVFKNIRSVVNRGAFYITFCKGLRK